MGAVTFSLDQRLVSVLKKVLPLTTLVETGTFKGDTIDEFQSDFSKIYSIELSKKLSAAAQSRFEKHQHIHVLQGNSPDKLLKIVPKLNEQSTLYWLDAHWCVATDTAGEQSQCPLIEEIKAIKNLNAQSVVLIDDARLFLSPPLAPHEISQWPSFQEILNALFTLSQNHSVMVINDVIMFYPNHIKLTMETYAQTNSIDLLNLTNRIKEYESLRKSVEEKEVVIKQLSSALFHYKLAFAVLKPFLRPLNFVLNSIYRLCAIKRILKVTKHRIKTILSPRLGNLNQYAPRPLEPKLLTVKTNAKKLTPKVSIVTPSYQQGNFIERTIKSVLNQQYPNLEYFVQDGGSTDTTVDILKKYQSKLSGWKSQPDQGQSQAINLGFFHTTGEIMAWLNSDDLLMPGALDVVIDYFNQHPDVDVVYGNRLLINEDDMEIGRWILPCHDGEALKWADYIPQETMFWRRSIWNKVGGQIDESFKFAMDWDLLIRFQEAGAKFAHIPLFLGAFRIHVQQKTSAAISDVGYQEMNRIRSRIHGSVPNHNDIRKNVFVFMLKHIAVDLIYRIKMRIQK